MIRHSLLPLLLLTTLSSLTLADSPPLSAPADALVMHQQMIKDPYPKMDAYSILVPTNWQMGSTITWIPGNAAGPHVDITVYDPNQRTAVRLYPNLFFTDGIREINHRNTMRLDPSGRLWNNTAHLFEDGQPNGPGSEIRDLSHSNRDFLLNVLIPKLRPGLAAAPDITVLSDTDLPDYAKAKAAASGNPNAKFTCNRLRISYTGPKGQMEEEFVCTIRTQPIGFGENANTLWDADVTSALAPKGKLDALLPTLTAVAASKQIQLPYYNFVYQIGQMILQAQRDELQQMIHNDSERLRIYGEYQRKASADLSDHIRDNFAKQQDAKAAGQSQFMHYINDTAAYTNPSDHSQLALPANYKYNYISNHGDIIQTNDATFQPPIDPNTNWNNMQKNQ